MDYKICSHCGAIHNYTDKCPNCGYVKILKVKKYKPKQKIKATKKKIEEDSKTKKKRKYRNNDHIKIFNMVYPGVNSCQKCGSTFHLQIHHIDKNHNNNHGLNLIKLCLHCHTAAHEGDHIYKLMKSRLDFLLQ